MNRVSSDRERSSIPVKLSTALTTASLSDHDFEDDATYTGLDYNSMDLIGRKAESMEISQCRFADSRLPGAQLSKTTFTDCVITNCDLANLAARDCSLSSVAITGSRMTGSSWAECVFRDTVFSDCRIDLAIFRFGTFRRTTFRECNLREADFQNADLRRIEFISCDLKAARFANAQLHETRFSHCDLYGISGVTSMRGAIVKSDDALSLAHSLAAALDITVES